MSWLDKILPPKIKNRSKSEGSSNVPEGLWHKCPSCSATIYSTELQQNDQVCPKCNHHNPLSARERLNLLLDEEGREEIAANIKPTDPLKFKDSKKYPERLAAARKATGEDDALVVMKGFMNGLPVVIAAFEFRFIGGSMGSVVGERFVQGVRRAVADNCSFICVAASGGARMQEGVNSLMQMTKTSAALHLLTEKHLPFISVLTDPTMAAYPPVSPSSAMSCLPNPTPLSALPALALLNKPSAKPYPKASNAQNSCWKKALSTKSSTAAT